MITVGFAAKFISNVKIYRQVFRCCFLNYRCENLSCGVTSSLCSACIRDIKLHICFTGTPSKAVVLFDVVAA
ncbi:hypothetical protein DPMN_136381 [Dreissena polymorpha]|uniref:Uncharacterized protein n=1 Tax=Dreissena polymorpha TaxID=45954 RepID=A0A9D4G3I4_DREPO|nr:hypothetical protein DPMN_136381 [Dreissena polymorpha]